MTKDYRLLLNPLDSRVRVPNQYRGAYQYEEPERRGDYGDGFELSTIMNRYGEKEIYRKVDRRRQADPPEFYAGEWRNRWLQDQKVLVWHIAPQYQRSTGNMVQTNTGEWVDELIPLDCPPSLAASIDTLAAAKVAPTPARLTVRRKDQRITVSPVTLKGYEARPVEGTNQRLRYRHGDEPFIAYIEGSYIEEFDLAIPQMCWLEDAIFDDAPNADGSWFVLVSIRDAKLIISTIVGHDGEAELQENETQSHRDHPEPLRTKPRAAKPAAKPRAARTNAKSESQPVAALHAALKECAAGGSPITKDRLWEAFKAALGPHANQTVALQRARAAMVRSGELRLTEQGDYILTSNMSI